MDQDTERRAAASVHDHGEARGSAESAGATPPVEATPPADATPPGAVHRTEEPDQPVDAGGREASPRLTRQVHVVLGVVIAAVAGWLLYRSRTELAFRGPNHEPGPGYLPVLLCICLIGLGLTLAAVWMFGAKARHGEAPTLSLDPRHMGRALLVWLALVVTAFLIEPLGFVAAGEILVLLVIIGIERIRSIPMIVTLLLLPVAMYVLFDTLLEVQLPGGTLWY